MLAASKLGTQVLNGMTLAEWYSAASADCCQKHGLVVNAARLFALHADFVFFADQSVSAAHSCMQW